MAPAGDDLAYRRAGPADVAAVVALVESAYRGEASRAGWTTEADLLAGQRTDAEAVRTAVEHDGGELLVAELDGQVVACCRIERGAGAAHFGMFAVDPAFQGRSVGGTLLAEAERVARDEWRATAMRLEVIRQRIELIAWYERRGYELTGETEPFPYGDVRFGVPLRDDLEFVVLARALA